MFSDNLYFMSDSELRAYNRVCRAGNCRNPDRDDFRRFDSLMEKIGYAPDILRTKDGFTPIKCNLDKIYGEEEMNHAA